MFSCLQRVSIDKNNLCHISPSHDEVVLDGSLVEVGKLFPECLLIIDNLVSHVAHWSVQEGSHHVRSQTYNGSVEMKMMDMGTCQMYHHRR